MLIATGMSEPSTFSNNSAFPPSFAAGERSKTVRIAIYGDGTNEANESFQLLLSNPTGNAVISDPVGVGLILNDDVARGPGKKK